MSIFVAFTENVSFMSKYSNHYFAKGASSSSSVNPVGVTILTGDRLPELDLGLPELLEPLLDLVGLRDLIELSLLGRGSISINGSLRLVSEKTYKMYESFIGKFFQKVLEKCQNSKRMYLKFSFIYTVESSNRIYDNKVCYWIVRLLIQ